VSRFQYPPNVRIIRVPCASRVNPMFVLRSLQKGADGVLVAGCHPGECHYSTGNMYARRKLMLLRNLLEHIGIEKERLSLAWISSAEGEKFAKVARETVEKVRKLGPSKKMVKKEAGVVG
jgi:F420-non-reducing hydrogenase iron-sulfur subunit